MEKRHALHSKSPREDSHGHCLEMAGVPGWLPETAWTANSMTGGNTILAGLLSRLRQQGGLFSRQKSQQAEFDGSQDDSSANARRVHDIRVVGNRFVYLGRKHDYRLTSVGLQKFIFLAHGWHMGLHGIENRLIDDRVEVWRLGPVAPSGYHAFCGLGYMKRTYAEIPDEVKSELNEVELKTCDFVMERYGHLSPFDLTQMTYQEGSPWHKHRYDLYSEIPREDIYEYYHEIAENLGMIPATESTT